MDEHGSKNVEKEQSTSDRSKKVTVSRRQSKNKWDKRHACKYCHKERTQMNVHLQQKHANEAEVARAMAMPKKSKERRQAFIQILNEGDFSHNFEVLKNQNGKLIQKYRSEKREATEYLACIFCKAMYAKNLLAVHTKKCKQRPDGHAPLKRGESSAKGRMMLPLPEDVCSSFFVNVIHKMKDDDIAKLVKNDSLILQYGKRLFYRRDAEEHSPGQISCRLRELASVA